MLLLGFRTEALSSCHQVNHILRLRLKSIGIGFQRLERLITKGNVLEGWLWLLVVLVCVVVIWESTARLY